MATASNMRWNEEDIAEARESVAAKEREYLRRLNRCTCPRPVPARLYGDEWACALCDRVTGVRPHGRGTRTARGAPDERGGHPRPGRVRSLRQALPSTASYAQTREQGTGPNNIGGLDDE